MRTRIFFYLASLFAHRMESLIDRLIQYATRVPDERHTNVTSVSGIARWRCFVEDAADVLRRSFQILSSFDDVAH